MGRFTRQFIAEVPGYVHDGDDVPTVEEVAEHWAQINSTDGYYLPTSTMDWSARFMAHRRPSS